MNPICQEILDPHFRQHVGSLNEAMEYSFFITMGLYFPEHPLDYILLNVKYLEAIISSVLGGWLDPSLFTLKSSNDLTKGTLLPQHFVKPWRN